MPSDPGTSAFDVGLLSPVTVGADAAVSDAAVLGALVAAEVALVRAWARLDVAPSSVAAAVSSSLGWVDVGQGCQGHGVDASALAVASISGGNPVIPLVGELKDRVSESARAWVHRGATSQDIVDSGLMLVSRGAGSTIVASLVAVETALTRFAAEHRDVVAAARTLTQHAVPTTIGARAATWTRGVARARERLGAVLDQLPAQLGGAAGTLASFDAIARQRLGVHGRDVAARLPAAFAAELGLAAPDAPWHTTRWPVTELGDALVQTVDAVGKIATDVATLSRTEIGELSEGTTGGSSAMPQKHNPATSVLIRSAALRAPQLSATLHLASALAGDERPDGAWHAEWPTLRELLRLALGASAAAGRLTAGLRVDADAVAENLALTRGLISSERWSIELTPIIGRDRVAAILASAADGGDVEALIHAELQGASDREGRSQFPVGGAAAFVDPAHYTGLAGRLVDNVAHRSGVEKGDPAP